jgi:hypothetical protein
LSWGAEDGELAVELVGAFAHAEEAEVAAGGGWEALGVEALAVVADGEGEVVGLEVEADLDAGGVGVLEGVGDGFEGDAEDVVLGGGGEVAGFALDVELDVGGGVGVEGGDGLAEGGDEAVGVGAEVPDGALGFGLAAADLGGGE